MSSPSPGLPRKLGRFKVGAKIGGGGMASVYLGAASDRGKPELVALKVIRDELAKEQQFRDMFVDEAKILARLSHPNVIRTLEYGITGQHRFIAMELLSGRTYADVWDLLATRTEAVGIRLGAWICARVADGLHSAHELVDESGVPLSVIHRDVNPTNIFLTHDGYVKLIDFGLAKARVRVSRSADGIVKGKIPYLSPEQAHGRPIDRRTDVYALGTTLWESVTMRRLFKRENDVATLRAIRDADVPDARTINPELPEALAAIIERSLRSDPAERFQTAEELATAIDGFLGDGTDRFHQELAALVARLFPGQEAEHERWLLDVTSAATPAFTMPPPAPLPTASSRLIDSPVVPAEPSRVAAEDRDVDDANAAPIDVAPRSEATPDTRRSPSLRTDDRAGDAIGASASDPNASRRLVFSILVVLALLAALTYALR